MTPEIHLTVMGQVHKGSNNNGNDGRCVVSAYQMSWAVKRFLMLAEPSPAITLGGW